LLAPEWSKTRKVSHFTVPHALSKTVNKGIAETTKKKKKITTEEKRKKCQHHLVTLV
jgi:hypothetical protein